MKASARKLVMLAVTSAALVLAGASASASGSGPQVSGAGYTSNSGHVVINARAIGPQDGFVSPAAGFITVNGSVYGDLRGSVSCIGTLFAGSQVAVSGTLASPVTVSGQSYSTFTYLVGSTVILYLKNGDPQMFDCGVNIFFFDDVPWTDPNYVLQSGHFTVR